MKPNTLLASGAVLIAAWMTGGQVLAQSSGSKSDPARESGVARPDESPSKSRAGSSDASLRGTGAGMDNIRGVQQALKDKGHDPGPVDGVMGTRTKDAIKSFQTASNLQPTGNLNAETSEKLGVQASGSQGSRGSSTGSTKPRDPKESDNNMKSKSGNLNEESAGKASGQTGGSQGSSTGSMKPRDSVKEPDDNRKSK